MAVAVLRTLIVDDEPVDRSVLAEELADNGQVALRCIEQLSPDLVVLAIQMPVRNGFEVVLGISGPLPAIISATAFSEHALRAFEVGAVDYMLKPISVQRLAQAVANPGGASCKSRAGSDAPPCGECLSCEALAVGQNPPRASEKATALVAATERGIVRCMSNLARGQALRGEVPDTCPPA